MAEHRAHRLEIVLGLEDFHRDAVPEIVGLQHRIADQAAVGLFKGKHAGLPVWRVLGGEPRPIPTYATGGYYRPGAPDTVYAEELAGFVQAGYRAVKLKTGAGSPGGRGEAGADRARGHRQDISLMLDMNAPYDVDGCIEFARRVDPLDIYWLEEPLHWYLQPADFVRLAAATSIPLAHAERELTRFTVRDFIATGLRQARRGLTPAAHRPLSGR